MITAVPLICFGAAAVRVPLSTLGLLQYLAPTFQFVAGLAVFHEAMPPERWAGFALVWLALALLTWDALRTGTRARTALADAAARAGAATAGGAVPAADAAQEAAAARNAAAQAAPPQPPGLTP